MAKNLTAALALMGVSAAASATPVSVSQTISLSQLLSGNSSTSISFDLNAQLATAGQSAGNIFSGDLVVFGYSDAQYNSTVTDPYGGYVLNSTSTRQVSVPYTYYQYCSSWSWNCYSGPYTGYDTYNVSDYSYVRSRDVEHIDSVADTMTVTAGASSASASANTTTSSVGEYGGLTLDTETGSSTYGMNYYYDRQRDTYQAIDGPIETTLSLDSTALADLMADGILAPTVQATLGGFHLTSATLTVEAESKVPEPGTLALFAGAAAAGALTRRRRKK